MVSVIIPVYNCEKYIAQAIESVLNQTTKEEIEILVIDDGSKDKTKQIVQKYMDIKSSMRRVRFFVNEKNCSRQSFSLNSRTIRGILFYNVQEVIVTDVMRIG